jgi:AcrR family transcriptional regulator
MAKAETSTERPGRGRPQLRSDEETRRIIYDAARQEFAANGYAATSTEMVARRAGISTKTLYRLVPNKAALFESMVSDRLDRLALALDITLSAGDEADIETALNTALMVCAEVSLAAEVVALQRFVLQEASQFSDLATTFYRNGVTRLIAALADWLRIQIQRGRLKLDDPVEAAGILIGMVASAPQRAAIYGGVPLPSRSQIERRVKLCTALFLKGCRAADCP